MRVTVPRVVCTGKPEPRPWDMNGRSGVSYKVEVSDGTGNLSVSCENEAIYAAFAPFQAFEVTFNVRQRVGERGSWITMTAIAVSPVK